MILSLIEWIVFHSFAVFAKNIRFGKRRQNQQKVPRVMNTNASDGPGTNSQQVENRREFRDKTKLGQVFKLSARFGHFASEVDSHSWQRLTRGQIWSIWNFTFAVLVLNDLWMLLCLGKPTINEELFLYLLIDGFPPPNPYPIGSYFGLDFVLSWPWWRVNIFWPLVNLWI